MMTRVNIFIAAPNDELRDDRAALEDFVRNLNDIYMERGVYLRLFIGSEELYRADQLKESICSSQLCFFISFNSIDEMTLDQFETAYEYFLSNGAPAIITCFRQGAGYAPQQSVLSFMRRLGDELGHYYKTYESIDSLKLCLLMQLKLMNLDLPIEFHDGRASVDGREVLTLENLPVFVKNQDFLLLRNEYEACDAVFLAAKERYLADPSTEADFLAASERRNTAKDALQKLEEQLFKLLLGAEEGIREKLTARQRKAYALMERGESAMALEMLNEAEIDADCNLGENLAGYASEKLAACASEYLMRANVKETCVSDPRRFDEIERLYIKAVEIAEKYNLDKGALRDYCSYLTAQNQFKRAIPYAQRYKSYKELEKKEVELAEACVLLGNLYRSVNQREDAEAELCSAKNVFNKLSQNEPRYLPMLAYVYNNLGALYSGNSTEVLRRDIRRLRKAEDALVQARTIWEKLAEKDRVYSSKCGLIGNNLALLYESRKLFDRARDEYLRSMNIFEAHCISDPESAECALNLASVCNNLGYMYFASKRASVKEAEGMLLRAKELRERFLHQNPNAILPDLGSSCYNLALLYGATGRPKQAEDEYLRAKNIYWELAANNPGAFFPQLLKVCAGLGEFYKKTGRAGEAYGAVQPLLDMAEQLAKENPATFSAYLIALRQELSKFQRGLRGKAKLELQQTKDILEFLKGNMRKH